MPVRRVLDEEEALLLDERLDLRHAARSLARARAFTLVCIISLGVGMGAFVTFVTFFRAMVSPARVIDTNRLVEILVRPIGPLRVGLPGALHELVIRGHDHLHVVEDAALEAAVDRSERSDVEGVPLGRRETLLVRRLEVGALRAALDRLEAEAARSEA